MAIHITPELVELSYERLRASPPFKKWNLPHADDVEFHVTRDEQEFGALCYETDKRKGKRPRINVSCVLVRTLDKLDETLAHEMCHMRELNLGVRSNIAHGRAFNRLADKVCAIHGFRRGTF